MALPIIKQPTYKIFFHSIKKEVEYRPYTVGEEKILIMISESKDPKFISTNMKKVLQACILDPDVQVEKLASYDVENLLLKIRAKSTGEEVELKYVDPETKKSYAFSLDLEKLDITFDPEHEYKIEINKDVGLIMKDLSFEKMIEFQEKTTNSTSEQKAGIMFDTLLECVDSVYDADNVYKVGVDTSKEELVQFVSGLTNISKKLYKFMETMPAIIHDIEMEDGKVHRIRDIKSFLA